MLIISGVYLGLTSFMTAAPFLSAKTKAGRCGSAQNLPSNIPSNILLTFVGTFNRTFHRPFYQILHRTFQGKRNVTASSIQHSIEHSIEHFHRRFDGTFRLQAGAHRFRDVHHTCHQPLGSQSHGGSCAIGVPCLFKSIATCASTRV